MALATYHTQGCYISREICLFPGWREILGNTGKYKISNNGLLVGPVVGVLICWKLIKLGTKTHYRSNQGNQNSFIHLSKSYFHKTIHFQNFSCK